MKNDAWDIHEVTDTETNYWPDFTFVGLAVILFIVAQLLGWF